MTPNRAAEVLYESEATLRLVDRELGELKAGEPAAANDGAADGRTILASLPYILQLANAEIVQVITSLRESRSALEHSTVERIQHTHSKLQEVTSATETATNGILDALDRAQGLIDELDADTGDGGRSKDVRNSLRDEIFGIIGALQFQDITTQQINYASNVLLDMEAKLLRLMQILDPGAGKSDALPQLPPLNDAAPTFDMHATVQDQEKRQSVADEVFSSTPKA
ncbi:MAG: hypothetical protein HYR75_03735 [Gemmatimonadetes bacterium]|nr:hypothetical protein [Gemmatimonadota bacterium]MBI3568289.1 hypothetical protein [Gemmatimonadota bacterium]